MKVLLRQYRERRFYVLVNMVKSPGMRPRIYRKLEVAVSRFLHFRLIALGLFRRTTMSRWR